MANVEILIIHLNGAEVIKNCLNSIFDDNPRAKVRLLFNQTTDNSIELVKDLFPKVTIHSSRRRMGFAESSNFLAKKSKAGYIIFLNI